MSDMTIVDKQYIDELEVNLAYTTNQLEMAQKEIARLNERIHSYEKNDKITKGNK
tara:strand:- start:2437 stop:2601 length:165 start_codon:yes stop_codon:yes gene_type:complete